VGRDRDQSLADFFTINDMLYGSRGLCTNCLRGDDA
jgi:hypothetical protein